MAHPNMSRFTNADFSLRHLPDVSDTSLSFQIPADSHETRLMDEDSHAFLDALDDRLITPAPARVAHAPLTLSDLTPQSKVDDLQDALLSELPRASSSKPILPPSFSNENTHTTFEPERRKTAQPEHASKPPAAVERRTRSGRLFSPRKARERAPADECPAEPLAPPEKRRRRPKVDKLVRETVDGEFDRGGQPTQNTATYDDPPCEAIIDTPKDTVFDRHPEEKRNDANQMHTQLKSPSERITEASVSSFIPEPFSSTEADAGPSVASGSKSHSRPERAEKGRDSGPLTLSQLSPRKENDTAWPLPRPAAPSPTRPAHKRSASPSTELDPPQKTRLGTMAGRESKRRKTLQLSIVKNSIAPRVRAARLSPARRISTGRRAVTSSRRKGGPTVVEKPGTSRPQERGRTTSADKRQDLVRQASGPMPEAKKPSVTLPSTKPMIPIGFHFQVDARIAARKQEPEEKKMNVGSKRSKSRLTLPIPDFKALHAAEAELAAARRQHVAPTVPTSPHFSTEARLRERAKFEEARRAKELEIERQREEARLLRELEEQKEIRELRKKAVPRANEVPDWYATAPKRRREGS